MGMSIYIIYDVNKFKVGFTTNPKRRFAHYKTHNPTAKVQAVLNIEDKDLDNMFDKLLKVNKNLVDISKKYSPYKKYQK